MPLATHPLTDEELMRIWNEVPFYKNHNLVVTELHTGHAKIVVKPVPDIFRGGLGTEAMNGGMLAYVVDGVAGAAIASLTRAQKRTGTSNLAVQYLKALRGDEIHATSEVIRFGRLLAFATVELRDGEGNLCTTGQATYAILDW